MPIRFRPALISRRCILPLSSWWASAWFRPALISRRCILQVRAQVGEQVVPASAHIPTMYTGWHNDGVVDFVPASAHIPTMYTSVIDNCTAQAVPASAHIPTMYTRWRAR